jgi:hypothetical protein
MLTSKPWDHIQDNLEFLSAMASSLDFDSVMEKLNEPTKTPVLNQNRHPQMLYYSFSSPVEEEISQAKNFFPAHNRQPDRSR